MPSKRVSLKGKGADLFFSGEQVAVAETNLTESETSSVTSSSQGSQESSSGVPGQPDSTVAQRTTRTRRSQPLPATDTDEAIRDMSSMPDDSQANGQDIYQASTIARFNNETIDAIRKIVKVVGREVSFVRLSTEEKRRLAEIVFTYKMQGIKTSENEINRIAINLLLEDYETNVEQGVLARVLAALRA